MDPLNPIAFVRALVDIDSTTGREGQAGDWLTEQLERFGYSVERQHVSSGRFNVLATLDEPVVAFSTHYDCVPPFFPSRLEDGLLYGRGSCDAKGILTAQVAAAERLRAAGERRIALLFVVGEERGSDGATVANRLPVGTRYLINGEPTDGRLGIATRGVLRLLLSATGKAAHSSTPEEGLSAIDALLDALMALRRVRWPSDPELGETFYNVGLIEGGVAPNVVAPSASAEIMFRIVGDADDVVAAARAAVEPRVVATEVLRVPTVRLRTVDGFPTAVFPFTTDVPLLDRWGVPMLYGPGSIRVAHTASEHLPIAELERAIEAYVALARTCLASS